MDLQTFFTRNPKAAIAFSGGVDSAYLLHAAHAAGCDVHAYFVKSPFQPQFELDDAQRLADTLGVPFTVERCDPLQNPRVVQNDARRCYYCKRTLFSRLWELARADGYALLLDGTNASDRYDDRPGMQALRELGVRSPLRECGLTKPEIRARSREAGLFTHDKPAYACLATRIPTGVPIEAETLQRVERAESALFSLGFSDFRVRVLAGAARLQLPEGQLPRAVGLRAEIVSALSPDFPAVLLDLIPR